MQIKIATNCPYCGAPRIGRKRFACGTDRHMNTTELCNLRVFHRKNKDAVVSLREAVDKIAYDADTISELRKGVDWGAAQLDAARKALALQREIATNLDQSLTDTVAENSRRMEELGKSARELQAAYDELAAKTVTEVVAMIAPTEEVVVEEATPDA